MDEQEFVAVGIARQVIHAARRLPGPDTGMRVVHQLGGVPGRSRRRFQPGGIEGARPQRAVKVCPAGRRVGVIHMAGRTEKSLLSELTLVRPFRQIAMRLAGRVALYFRMCNPVFHGWPWVWQYSVLDKQVYGLRVTQPTSSSAVWLLIAFHRKP